MLREGGKGGHILAYQYQKASKPRDGRGHRIFILVGEGRFRGTRSGNQHLEENKCAGCPQWSLRILGLG